MGVERVRDVDVMPINPTENLPASFIESHSHILMNGHAMVEGQAVQHHRGSLRDGPPARGPAAGRAQQEARAAAAAAQAQSQESDMHTLSEVPSHCQHAHTNTLTGAECHSAGHGQCVCCDSTAMFQYQLQNTMHQEAVALPST